MAQLGNLHNIFFYNSTFLANNNHFLGELRFQNDTLSESLDVVKVHCRLIDVVIFNIISETSRIVTSSWRRVCDTNVTNNL